MKGSTVITSVLLYCVFTAENSAQQSSVDNVHVQLLEISSEAVFRYAKVSIKSVMINRQSVDQEVMFKVRLPIESYITSFVIITGDRRNEAEIKEKKMAQDTYNKAKEANVTAGLVSHQSISDDLDLEIFRIDVNVAAQAEVIFILKYEEFLNRRAKKYSQKLFVDSNHAIPTELRVSCTYKEKQKFKYLSYKAPYLKQRVLPEEGALSKEQYYVKTVDWEPSEYEQEYAAVGGLKEPFEVEYELELEGNGGMLYLNNEGNFVYLFSGPCTEEKIMSKQIVFVIDISGSMVGNPIQQVRYAMSSILSQLRETDYFSIIIFDSVSTMWKENLQRGNSENINAANIFVRGNIRAMGETNINDALLQAIDIFGTSESVERHGQIIVFLTDGKPTSGVRDTNIIRSNVRERNHVRGQCCKSTIYTIAYGRNADIEFLEQIAYENGGILTVIKEIDTHLAETELVNTYNNIENPYYKDLQFNFEVAGKSLPEANFTQSILPLYDCGSEIVISGSTLPGNDIFPKVKLIGAETDIIFDTVPTVKILGGESEMLTRLSVYQKVKQLLKEADISLSERVREAANKMALELALKYGFVTPLTSLIVTYYVPSLIYDRFTNLPETQTLSQIQIDYMKSKIDERLANLPVSGDFSVKRSRQPKDARSGYDANSSNKKVMNFCLMIVLYLSTVLIL